MSKSKGIPRYNANNVLSNEANKEAYLKTIDPWGPSNSSNSNHDDDDDGKPSRTNSDDSSAKNIKSRTESHSSVDSTAKEIKHNVLQDYNKGLNLNSSQDSRPPTANSDSSISSRESSRSGSSTGRSSIGENPEIEPLPYPDAFSFEKIQKEMKSITQKCKEALNNNTKPNTIVGKQMKELPNFYLFVVKDDSKDDRILCVFETKTEFKLETTNKYENTELLPKNYITSRRDDFNSVSQINKDKYLKLEDIPDSQSPYTGLGSYSPFIPGKIYFYVYNANSKLEKTYFTHGSIFIYGEGIASTCEIIELKINDNPMTKTDILPHINKIKEAIKFETTNSDKTYFNLITQIKSYVFGSDYNKDENKDLPKEKEKVYIHYLNAISPNDLKEVLNNDAKKIKAVVKILYVNISCPPDKSPDKYNLLHKYINYYYAYKTRSLSKIDEYIGSNEYSQFVMHIFDFFEFLMFLKDKENGLIECCVDIYNLYKANLISGFETLDLNNNNKLFADIQKKIKEKQKKIYTYLQIVDDKPTDKSEYYKVKLNKTIATYDGQRTIPDNDKSMELILNMTNGKINDKFEYKFGPFDKIYEPDITTNNDKYDQIVKSTEFNKIITKIQSGSPTLIPFYGISGSGKTKVLKKVVIDLCKKLGPGYSNLEIGFKEIFRKYDSGEIHNGEIQKINLSFHEGNFKIMSDITIDNYHDVKLERKDKKFEKNNTIDDVLKYILDENRLIKAILSNFHSSRSHILCFFKMTGAGKPDCNFIFADLAENEKKYDCSTALNNFKGIKKGEIPFYKDDFVDSYRGGANGIELSTFKKTGTSNPKPNDNIKKTGTSTNNPKPNDDNIKKACNHRVIEGEFINDSLKEFRTDLEYIVNVKNKDNEYYVPDIYTNIRDNYIKTCLQDFCFGKVNCFQMKKVEKIEAPKSIILKSVYDYLNIGSEQEFYDKLEVCLFGALNITHKDKEPPTIYVDINNVKSIIAGKDEFTFNNNPGVFEMFKYNLEKSYAVASRISNKHPVFPEKYIYDLLVKCKEMINKSLTLAEIETLKKVFDLIDDENAKTAIGTLEFMNRISKFNTVNSVCFIINDNRHYEPLKPP